MNRATWALLAASLLFGAAIFAFVVSSGGSTTRVVRTQTTVVEAPPLTPLPRDSGPKNNPRSTEKAAAKNGLSVPSQSTTTAPQNRSLPSRKRQSPKTTPTPRPSPQGQPQPHPAPSPQPSPPAPVVGVTAPAPVAVCARPAVTINC